MKLTLDLKNKNIFYANASGFPLDMLNIVIGFYAKKVYNVLIFLTHLRVKVVCSF